MSACKTIFFFLATALCASSAMAADMSYDIVDDFLKTAYTGAGSYDSNGDGFNDITISITQSNMGPDGNNVIWAGTDDTTTTGLRSTIDPSFDASGGVTSDNSGWTACQTITIMFNGFMEVEAQDITDFGWSSGNTAGIGWETSVLQYLDVNGVPFSTAPTIGAYLSHTATDGYAGTGTFVGDNLGTVTMVGTNQSASGSSGPNNGVSTDPVSSGIAPTTLIGGVTFTHCVQDVRGTNNGDTSFTATINDLDIEGACWVPEPGSVSLLSVGLLSLLGLRRRRS